MVYDKTKFFAAIQKKEDAAKGLMTDDDRSEMKDREVGAARLAVAKEEERASRWLKLARRLEDAEEKSPGVALRPLEIQEFADTFIIQRDGAAHASFEKLLAESSTNKKIDLAEIKRNYAIEVVYDWNGLTDWNPSNENGLNLRAFLETNPAVVTPIVNLALALNGAFAEERKS